MTIAPPRVLMFVPSLVSLDNPEAIVNAKFLAASLNAGWRIDAVTVEPRTPWYPTEDGVLSSTVQTALHIVKLARRRSVRDLVHRVRSGWACRPFCPPYGSPWSMLALQRARRLLRQQDYQFIISRALPMEAHIPALLLSRETGLPWIANWNDPAPLYMAPRPYGNGPTFQPVNRRIVRGIFSRNLRRLLGAVSRQAAWHTFPCERLRRYVCSYLPAPVFSRSSVIPHVALDRLKQPPQHPTGAFTLCYSGSLKRPRDPGTFLQAIRLFLDQVRPEKQVGVKFVGAHLEDVVPLVAALGLENFVTVEKAVPYETSLARLSRETVLVIIEAQMKEGVFLPSKLVDYVQAGRPILAISPRQGTVADLLAEKNAGLCADGESVPEIAAAVTALYHAWKKGTLEIEFASDRLWQKFSQESVLENYHALFDSLRRRPHPQRVALAS
jgi:glycosyltransferase involved in cell wall biosynthesis